MFCRKNTEYHVVKFLFASGTAGLDNKRPQCRKKKIVIISKTAVNHQQKKSYITGMFYEISKKKKKVYRAIMLTVRIHRGIKV